ncbi:MAG: hypothetical protein MRY63_06505 [Neomegalonema sp.]|nr:hypothetical protein [Neomegalonema sp.]
MSTAYFLKPQSAALDYSIDWSAALEEGEAISEDLGWSIHPSGTESGAPAVIASGRDASATTAQIEGGRPGARFELSSTIRTSFGRLETARLLVQII